MNKNIKYSQNFLTSEKVLNQIIKQLNLKETDTVYEIGTGKGHLTTKLAKISKQVTVIAGVFLIYGFNMDFIIKIMSIVRE